LMMVVAHGFLRPFEKLGNPSL
jgi:hypothetical protein